MPTKKGNPQQIEHKSIIQYSNNKDLRRISRLENIPMLSNDFLLRDRTFNVRTKSICKSVRYWAIATDQSVRVQIMQVIKVLGNSSPTQNCA